MAGVSIKGDSSKLRGLIARVQDFAGAGPMSEISKALAEDALYQIKQGFRRQQDPYGSAWAPLKRRKGKILRDTGRLANSFSRVRSGRDGFTVGSNVDYASVHQYGANFTATGRGSIRRKGRFISLETYQKKGRKKNGSLRKGIKAVGHKAHAVVIPQRMLVPVEPAGLPRVWEESFAKTAKRIVRRRLRR